MSHKAVFLDRDDTLISDPGYISDPAQVQLLPHVGHSLAMLKKMGYLLVVVTNQSGVARGIVTEQTLEQIHHHLKKLLADEGVYLDAIYYCPYHPEGTVAKYTRESDLRKPQPGMLLKAAEELDIDLSQSWMIGDSYQDIAAGSRAGCRTILLDTPGKPQVREPDERNRTEERLIYGKRSIFCVWSNSAEGPGRPCRTAGSRHRTKKNRLRRSKATQPQKQLSLLRPVKPLPPRPPQQPKNQKLNPG